MFRTLSSLAVLAVFAAGCATTPFGTNSPRRAQDTRYYPTSAKRTEGGQERYVVCHNGRSMTLPTPAVRAHLNHGDRFGECRRDRRDDRDRRRGRGRGNR